MKLCFVLMPFGKKPDASGLVIDFDSVYKDLIGPAIEAAGLTPIRADEEMAGGIIHKPMFERLVLCEFAIADLTAANANVFYELGVRHTARQHSTVLIFAEGTRLPFDVALLRALPYRIGSDGKPSSVAEDREKIQKQLMEARDISKPPVIDSPLFQLLDGYPNIDHTRTDVFRDQVEYSVSKKNELAIARKQGAEALQALEEEWGDLRDLEAGVVIDLYLSYRAVKAWDRMIALVDKMARPLRETVLVREQLGLALNRANRGDEAERVILNLLKERGPSSETYGILGRIYKDRWDAAFRKGQKFLAVGFLDKAIDAYLKGFDTDWRDAYPGINTVTLMELKEPPDPRGKDLIPIVAHAVKRKVTSGNPDYWDYATLLELDVLAGNVVGATKSLADALANVREKWEPETTANNLRMIREARQKRGEDVTWLLEIEQQLNEIAKG